MQLVNPTLGKIHEGSPETTQTANVANQMTTIAEILVPDGVAIGIKGGTVMNGIFHTSGDAALADGDEILLAYKKPLDDIWKPIPGTKLLIGAFNNTAKADQNNSQNDAPRTIRVTNGKGYELLAPKDRLGILVKSASVVSYTHSFFVLPVTRFSAKSV